MAFSRERISVIEQSEVELFRAGVESVNTSIEGLLKFWERDRCLYWGEEVPEFVSHHFCLAAIRGTGYRTVRKIVYDFACVVKFV